MSMHARAYKTWLWELAGTIHVGHYTKINSSQQAKLPRQPRSQVVDVLVREYNEHNLVHSSSFQQYTVIKINFDFILSC